MRWRRHSIQEWRSETQGLTPDARLVLFELADVAWETERPLPDDATVLRRLARCDSWTPRRFATAWALLRPMLERVVDGWLVPWIEADRAEVRGRRRALSDAGKRGARRRWSPAD